MFDWTDHRLTRCGAIAVAAFASLIAAGPAWPQAAPPSLGLPSPSQQSVPNPPPPPQQRPEPSPPAREENPGLIEELGKRDKSLSNLPKIKSPSETLDDIRGAGESLTNMAKP